MFLVRSRTLNKLIRKTWTNYICMNVLALTLHSLEVGNELLKSV